MQIVGIREAHSKFTRILHRKEPTIITKHGKDWIATIFPAPSRSLPVEIKKEIFKSMSKSFEKHLKLKKVNWERLIQEIE